MEVLRCGATIAVEVSTTLITHVAVAVLALHGTFSISEQRCPPGSSAGPLSCSVAQVRVSYTSPTRPAARAVAGAVGFARALRISATGSGRCGAESPESVFTSPDGAVQILPPASRLERFKTTSAVVLIDPHARTARFAWLDPLEPAFTCGYLGDPTSKLAVPTNGGLVPRALASGWISPRKIAAKRFSVVIRGSKTWDGASDDGLQLHGRASWNLRLDLGRPLVRQPNFLG
jgi:hypothetical protein